MPIGRYVVIIFSFMRNIITCDVEILKTSLFYISDNGSLMPVLRSAPGLAALVDSVSLSGVITAEGKVITVTMMGIIN